MSNRVSRGAMEAKKVHEFSGGWFVPLPRQGFLATPLGQIITVLLTHCCTKDAVKFTSPMDKQLLERNQALKPENIQNFNSPTHPLL